MALVEKKQDEGHHLCVWDSYIFLSPQFMRAFFSADNFRCGAQLRAAALSDIAHRLGELSDFQRKRRVSLHTAEENFQQD